MIRVGLARTTPSYLGLTAPWDPGVSYPEFASLLPARPAAPNHV